MPRARRREVAPSPEREKAHESCPEATTTRARADVRDMLRRRRRRVARAIAVLRRARARVDDAVLRECVEILIQTSDGVGACPRCRAAIVRDAAGAFVVGAASRVSRVPAGAGDGRDVRGVRARRTRGAAISVRAVRRRAAHTAPDVAVHGVADGHVERDVGVSRGVRGLHAVEDRFAGRGERAASDAPASWGSSEAWLAAAREEVERARASEARLEGARTTRRGGWGEGGGDGGAVGGGGGDDGVRRRTV